MAGITIPGSVLVTGGKLPFLLHDQCLRSALCHTAPAGIYFSRYRFARTFHLRIQAGERPHEQQPLFKGSKVRFAFLRPIFNFAADNFLPIALIGGVMLGFTNPVLGCVADKMYLSKFSTIAIFILSGLTLRNGEMEKALKAWPVGLLGLCSILLFTPCFSKIILQIHLQPQGFVTGLALFSCMPTTLSSGVALTNLAGGNAALALMMTVLSNLLGILTVPFSISRYIAAGVGVSLPVKQLFTNLIFMLLIPLIAGKAIRESFKGVGDFADKNRKLLSNISAMLLSMVPWIQVSRSRTLLVMVQPSAFLLATGLGVLLHLAMLVFNAVTLKIMSTVSGSSQSSFAEKENAYAFIIVSSQKTLPVLVAIVEQLGGTFGDSGLLVLPCVAAHLTQIIMDSFLVNTVFRTDNKLKPAKVA